MKLRYSQREGLVSLMEVNYNFVGTNLVRRYSLNSFRNQYLEISFVLLVSHEFHVPFYQLELVF